MGRIVISLEVDVSVCEGERLECVTHEHVRPCVRHRWQTKMLQVAQAVTLKCRSSHWAHMRFVGCSWGSGDASEGGAGGSVGDMGGVPKHDMCSSLSSPDGVPRAMSSSSPSLVSCSSGLLVMMGASVVSVSGGVPGGVLRESSALVMETSGMAVSTEMAAGSCGLVGALVGASTGVGCDTCCSCRCLVVR